MSQFLNQFMKKSDIWLWKFQAKILIKNCSYFGMMAKVMIADDYDDTRLVLKDIIDVGKHELVAEAADGEEAISKFNANSPDLLLLDIAMPKKDGIQVLHEIKKSCPDAKIIMLTANENMDTIQDCIAAGALAYIVKPFELENVLQTISFALE